MSPKNSSQFVRIVIAVAFVAISFIAGKAISRVALGGGATCPPQCVCFTNLDISGVTSTSACFKVAWQNPGSDSGCCQRLPTCPDPEVACHFRGNLRFDTSTCSGVAGICQGPCVAGGCSGTFVIPASVMDHGCRDAPGQPKTFTFSACTSAGATVASITIPAYCFDCN